MLDESHVDVAGQQGELYRAQLVESPAIAAASCGDRLAPNRGHLFAQWLALDLPDAGKELREKVAAVWSEAITKGAAAMAGRSLSCARSSSPCSPATLT